MQGYELEPDAQSVPVPVLGGKSVLGPQVRVALAGIRKGTHAHGIVQAVRDAVLDITDFRWLSRGDTVFVKTANSSPFRYPATTHPLAVVAVVGLLREHGAGRVIVGDMSGVRYLRFTPTSCTGSTRMLMADSGMAAAVLAAGGELHCFEEPGWDHFYEENPAPGSHWKYGLTMPAILREVRHIVLMPRCSRHVITGSTLGLKAAAGYWRPDTRLEFHRDASTLQEKTAEGNTVPTLLKKQRLVVSMAHKILTTVGPDRGHVFQPGYGLVLASESVVAHDMVALAWLLDNRRSVPFWRWDRWVDRSEYAARFANRLVTNWLGGWRTAMEGERVNKDPLNTIWDDRVLLRSYELFGGVPDILLAPANKDIVSGLRTRLARLTAPPPVYPPEKTEEPYLD